MSCYIAFPLLFEYDFESSRFSVRDLSTGTHRVICESLELQGGVSPAIVKVLDDYVIFESLSDSSDETLRWAVSVETGQCYPLYLTYDLTFRGDAHHYFFNVLAETEDSYLVEVGGERVLYTDTLADGSKLQAEGYDMLYALMKKQDYVNNDSTKMQPIEMSIPDTAVDFYSRFSILIYPYSRAERILKEGEKDEKGLCLLMAAILFFSACAQEVDSSSSVSGTLLSTQVDHSLYPIRGGDLQMVTSNGGASQTAISSDGAYQLVPLTDGGWCSTISTMPAASGPLVPQPGVPAY